MASEYVVQVENIVNGLCAFYTVVFTDDPRGDVRGFRGSFQCRDFCSVEYLFNRFGRLGKTKYGGTSLAGENDSEWVPEFQGSPRRLKTSFLRLYFVFQIPFKIRGNICSERLSN